LLINTGFTLNNLLAMAALNRFRKGYNLRESIATDLFLLLYILAVGAWVLYISLHLTCPVDIGDGIMHYSIAQGSWENPLLLLDHWGKPLFTLISSPFAQFGLEGMIRFNILVFILTCITGFRILKIWKVPVLLQLFLPILLLLAHDYFIGIVAGLTEPFFGFLLVLAAYFLTRKKYIAFALVVSLLPFARSEGQLIVPLAGLILLFLRQWKALPFLLAGWLLYAVIGFFALGDFWWYFHNNPYPGESIYGHGEWNHFWKHKVNYLGRYGFATLALGIVGMLYTFMIDGSRRIRWDVLFLAGSSFLGIVLVHAYLWKFGKSGSLGLTRVCTLGLPLLMVISLYMIRQLAVFRYWAVQLLALLVLGWISYPLLDHPYFYQQPPPMEKCIIAAAEYVKREREPGAQVYYHSPLFGLEVGANLVVEKGDYHFYYFQDVHAQLAKMHKGDLIVRDSMFGPKEFGLPLDSLQNIPDWQLVQEFVPEVPGVSYHGEPWGVKIYRKVNDTP
jgi:hypothetical protein